MNDSKNADDFIKNTGSNYIELQYHGDLTPDDIESIAVPYLGINDADTKNVIQKCKKRGIKIYGIGNGGKFYEL